MSVLFRFRRPPRRPPARAPDDVLDETSQRTSSRNNDIGMFASSARTVWLSPSRCRRIRTMSPASSLRTSCTSSLAEAHGPEAARAVAGADAKDDVSAPESGFLCGRSRVDRLDEHTALGCVGDAHPQPGGSLDSCCGYVRGGQRGRAALQPHGGHVAETESNHDTSQGTQRDQQPQPTAITAYQNGLTLEPQRLRLVGCRRGRRRSLILGLVHVFTSLRWPSGAGRRGLATGARGTLSSLRPLKKTY